MQIDREVHIAASLARVRAYAEQCPCPSALTLIPQGAGTRARIRADVSPDDLGNHVEEQLVELLRTIRAHFEQADEYTDQ